MKLAGLVVIYWLAIFLAIISVDCGEVTARVDSGMDSGTPDATATGGQAGMAGAPASTGGAGGAGAGGTVATGGAGSLGTGGAVATGGAGGAPALCCEACGTSPSAPACAACPDPPKGSGRVCGCGSTATLCCCFNPDGSPHCSGSVLPICQ